MNYNYTEEHYAEMYNNLPEGLKDLVLSGRLALQVSAIGARHGLNADQVADLEPAVEDVCLGLILKPDLAENIKVHVGTDDRVSNRIAAEVEIEILRPFEPELIIARQQKEDLDKKIASPKSSASIAKKAESIETPKPIQKEDFEPRDVSDKSNVTAIKNFYNSSSSGNSTTDNSTEMKADTNKPSDFDWESLGKKTPKEVANAPETKPVSGPMSVDEKIDKLTDTINKLVSDRFGGDKKDVGLSDEMKKIMERLEMAEKENQENKKLIEKLQSGSQLTNLQKASLGEKSTQGIFDLPKDANIINVDKPRSVNIDKSNTPLGNSPDISGNVVVQSVTQNPIPVNVRPSDEQILTETGPSIAETPAVEKEIFSSVVSQSTADAIVETKQRDARPIVVNSSTKSVLSLDELLQKNDTRANATKPTSAQIAFPTIGTEKKIDIKNIAQTDGLRQSLIDDLTFIKSKYQNKPDTAAAVVPANPSDQAATIKVAVDTEPTNTKHDDIATLKSMQSSVTLDQFKNELVPKTKEDRMRALQDKIKSMNKGVSSGGANSIAASALDPYKL